MDLGMIEKLFEKDEFRFRKYVDGDWEVLKLEKEYTFSTYKVEAELIFEASKLNFLRLSEKKFGYFLRNFNTNQPSKFTHLANGTFMHKLEAVKFSYFSKEYTTYINSLIQEFVDQIRHYLKDTQDAIFKVNATKNILDETEKIGSYTKITSTSYKELTNTNPPETFQPFTLIQAPLDSKGQVKYSAYTKLNNSYTFKTLKSQETDLSQVIKDFSDHFQLINN